MSLADEARRFSLARRADATPPIPAPPRSDAMKDARVDEAALLELRGVVAHGCGGSEE
jgi:hypothetical protein